MQYKCMVLVVSAALAIVSSASRVVAHDFITDQECVPGQNSISLRNEDPLGQEFVPQLSSLDVVELYMSNGSSAPATVAVRIRLHTIDGPIVATSADLVIPGSTPASYRHFDFVPSVALVPGELYAMEFVLVSGSGNPTVDGPNYNAYAPGRSIYGNLLGELEDFTFREGPVSPVAIDATTWGKVKALYH